MSEIIKARKLIKSVIDHCDIDRSAKVRLGKAHRLMFREPWVQRVPPKPQRITAVMRRRIHSLCGTMSIHEIANAVGLRNSGRVSEVLNNIHAKRRAKINRRRRK